MNNLIRDNRSRFYLKFLSSNSIRSGPHLIVFLEDFRVFDDSLQLWECTIGLVFLFENTLKDASVDKGLLSDHSIVLVVGVVGVSHLSIRSELELKELVAELSLVADVVSNVEVVGTGHSQFLKARRESVTYFLFRSRYR